jgi:hypothetical protein
LGFDPKPPSPIVYQSEKEVICHFLFTHPQLRNHCMSRIFHTHPQEACTLHYGDNALACLRVLEHEAQRVFPLLGFYGCLYNLASR